MFSSGGGALLSFMLSVLIGRVLGDAGLGAYAAVLAWIFPLSIMAEFGLGTLITRDGAQQTELAHVYLRQTSILRLLIGGGLLLSLWIFAPLLSNDALVVAGLRLSSPLLLIFPMFGAFTAVFRSQQAMRPVAWLNVGMLAVQVPLTALVFAFGGGVLLALLVNLLTSAGQLVAAWWIYRRRFYVPVTDFAIAAPLWMLLKRGWPFALAAIISALYLRSSLILLEQFGSIAQVGVYAAAWRFVDAGVLLARAFFDALFPMLAGLAAEAERLRRLFRRVLLGLALAGAAFAVGASLLAEPIISLTYGADFAASVPVLRLAAWSLLPLLLKNGLIVYHYAQGHESRVNRVLLLTLLLRVVLSLWLIPASGASGAVWANLLSDAVGALLLSVNRNDPL